MHCEPVPLAWPHRLLFRKYLLTSIDVEAVHDLPTCAALPQLTLEGSRQAPYRHCWAPVHFVPQVPQLLTSFVTSRHVPPQAA